MNFQKAKAILILFGFITVVAIVTFFLTDTYYKPVLKEGLKADMDKEQNLQSVLVATKEIPMGTPITSSSITIASVPFANVSDKVCKGTEFQSVIGALASVNINKNEQIVKNKLVANVELTPEQIEALNSIDRKKFEPSYRYITIDVPKYNFVNERVSVNSLVDILVDQGQGKYDVVLAKVAIIDKIPIISSGTQSSTTNSAGEQIKKPLPKPLLINQNTQGYKPGMTADQLMRDGNPALEDSADYRITIMATEKEQKVLFLAATYGKFMLREYVLPSQPKSIETFKLRPECAAILNNVSGDGTVGMPKIDKEKDNTSEAATGITNQQ